MNYERIYNNLVFKRQHVEILPDDAIFEKHHVIPRSIRPDLEFEQSNIVRLTLKEHFICHQMLVKIYAQKYGENSNQYIKMVNALFIMSGYKRYGKMLSANQYVLLKSQYRRNINDILKEAWKNYPKEKMDELREKRRINSSGSNNPMYRRSWKVGKTEEELLQHRINTSIGLRNRTLEEKIATRQKIIETINKKSDEEKLKTIQKRNASRKKFYEDHPEKRKEVTEKIAKMSKGRRKLFKENKKPIYVNAPEISKYLNDGWKFSLHVVDKTNPAYGRKWLHIKGSTRKEDKVYAKHEDIDFYLERGYVLGIKDKQ